MGGAFTRPCHSIFLWALRQLNFVSRARYKNVSYSQLSLLILLWLCMCVYTYIYVYIYVPIFVFGRQKILQMPIFVAVCVGVHCAFVLLLHFSCSFFGQFITFCIAAVVRVFGKLVYRPKKRN